MKNGRDLVHIFLKFVVFICFVFVNYCQLIRYFVWDSKYRFDFMKILVTGGTGYIGSHTVVELQQNVPQRIRMFVWVEGQDVDCANVMEEAGLMIHLELAGASR